MKIDTSLLRRLPLFKDLTASDLDRIASFLKPRRLNRNEALFYEGDPGLGIWLLLNGSIKLTKTDSTGREQLLKVVLPHEFFAEVVLFDGGTYPATAVASTDGLAYVLYNDDARALIYAHPELAWHFLHVLSQRLRTAQDRIRILCASDVTARLAAILLHLAQEQQTVHLQLGRQDLANMAGVARETVSRILSSFAEAGHIKLGRNMIGIIHKDKLAEIATQE